MHPPTPQGNAKSSGFWLKERFHLSPPPKRFRCLSPWGNFITPLVIRFADQPELDVEAKLEAARASVRPRIPLEA